MMVKSVMAGEYTAPPAHGPITSESCGTTPDASVFRRKMSAYPPSETTPSWIRAPPESLMPTIGAPTFIARSMSLQIFVAYASDSEPPKTVKSWLKTKIGRWSIVPCPVTTPSPRIASASPSVPRAVTKASIDERVRVQQEVDPLARRQLPARMLRVDAD